MRGNTIPVDKSKYKNYLQKAEECARYMHVALERKDFDACVINAIHCGISAADSLCVLCLGLRHKGERHYDAVELFQSIDLSDEEIKKNADHLGNLLSIKSRAEYGEKLITSKEAEIAVKEAERLFYFVKKKISHIVR